MGGDVWLQHCDGEWPLRAALAQWMSVIESAAGRIPKRSNGRRQPYEDLVRESTPGYEPAAADRAVDAIETCFELLENSPFSCRKAWPGDRPLLRELVIPFGSAGYVAMFEIDGPSQVSILAVRHQREEDYY